MAQEDEGFSATALPGEVDGDAAVGAAKKALAMASEEADEVGQRTGVIAVLLGIMLIRPAVTASTPPFRRRALTDIARCKAVV